MSARLPRMALRWSPPLDDGCEPKASDVLVLGGAAVGLVYEAGDGTYGWSVPRVDAQDPFCCSWPFEREGLAREQAKRELRDHVLSEMARAVAATAVVYSPPSKRGRGESRRKLRLVREGA